MLDLLVGWLVNHFAHSWLASFRRRSRSLTHPLTHTLTHCAKKTEIINPQHTIPMEPPREGLSRLLMHILVACMCVALWCLGQSAQPAESGSIAEPLLNHGTWTWSEEKGALVDDNGQEVKPTVDDSRERCKAFYDACELLETVEECMKCGDGIQLENSCNTKKMCQQIKMENILLSDKAREAMG